MAASNENSNGKIGTIIGAGTSLKGNLASESNIRIDGRFEGNIRSKGNIFVGKTGDICANMMAQNIVVSGKVQGCIHASTRLEVIATAHIVGDIFAPRISIAEGVYFEGNCSMTAKKAAPLLEKQKKMAAGTSSTKAAEGDTIEVSIGSFLGSDNKKGLAAKKDVKIL